MSRIAPGLQILAGWDRILTAGDVDSVIVCGTDASILEGAKQIAAAGKPLVIYPQGTQGSTWIYELGLIRDEGRTSIKSPCLPIACGRVFGCCRRQSIPISWGACSICRSIGKSFPRKRPKGRPC